MKIKCIGCIGVMDIMPHPDESCKVIAQSEQWTVLKSAFGSDLAIKKKGKRFYQMEIPVGIFSDRFLSIIER